MAKKKIGIIGAGRIGQLHAENIIHNFNNVTIKSISDPYLDVQWANSVGIEHTYKDHTSILNDTEIEAVLICSPSHTHSKLIIEAANQGKDIFCEKPIDLDPNAIKQALSVVEKNKVKLQVGFNRRFDPNFVQIKQHIVKGEIGIPHIIKITSRDPEPPNPDYIKDSGGMFLDMTVHDFDMARFLAASEVTEVYARGAVLVDPKIGEQGDIDTAIITLSFANGVIAVIDNSRKAAYGYDQRIEVFGSKGCTQAENNRQTNTTLLTEHRVQTDKPLFFFLERYKEAFKDEMGSFLKCLIDDLAPSVTGHDGLMPVLIALAANQSMKENRPVSLGEVG
jgi:myo-inositol 2-dehydrogenase / D-chiro-inositol 1-dehydrogenase